MQTSRNLVGILVKFTPRMQYGHDHFKCAALFFVVHSCWNTPSIVLYGNGVVFVNIYDDVVAMACQGFINRVVNYLIYKVVKTFYANITNIHGRSFSDRLQTFQHLNAVCAITVVGLL